MKKRLILTITQGLSNQISTIFQGHESFASYESLEQLHRLLFVLATIHVSYSFAAIALAMMKVQYHARLL